MWKQISKEEIKQVSVGDKIRVNGVETVLEGHYGRRDFGFDTKHKCGPLVLTTVGDGWDTEDIVVEVWQEVSFKIGQQITVEVGGVVYEGTVIGCHEGEIVCAMEDSYPDHCYDGFYAEHIKPAKTACEKWVEQALALDCEIYSKEATRLGMLSRGDFCKKLYKAMEAGELFVPEVKEG